MDLSYKNIKIKSNVNGIIKISIVYNKITIDGNEIELDKQYTLSTTDKQFIKNEIKYVNDNIKSKNYIKYKNNCFFWFSESILEIKQKLDSPNNHVPSFMWGKIISVPDEYIAELKIELTNTSGIVNFVFKNSNFYGSMGFYNTTGMIFPNSNYIYIGKSQLFTGYYFQIVEKPEFGNPYWKIIIYPNVLYPEVATEYLKFFYTFDNSLNKYVPKDAENDKFLLFSGEKGIDFDGSTFKINKENFKFEYPT